MTTTARVNRIEEPSAAAATLRQNAIGVWGVAFFLLAGVASLMVIGGLVPTSFAVTGLTAVPIYFLVVAVVLAVFLVGYLAMARLVPNAGAFYALVRQGLGRPAGVAAALVALVAYNALQIAVYGIFGFTTANFLHDKVGLGFPWWGYSLVAWAVVAVLGLLNVKLSAGILGVLSIAEFLVIVALSVSGVATRGAHPLAWDSLSPAHITFGFAGVGFLLAVLGYIGFENGPVLMEEARRPRRTVWIASFVVLVGIAALYVFAPFAMVTFWGADQIISVAAQAGPGTLFGMGPALLGDIALALFITSAFGTLLTFHNIVGRYAYSLGRENVLPKVFGQTGQKSGAPWVASLAQSNLALFVIFGYALAHLDPLVQLFFWVGTTGGFAVLCLLALSSLSVVAYFARKQAQTLDVGVWQRFIAPSVAFLALITMAVFSVLNYPTLMGLPTDSVVAKVFPAALILPAVVGLIWALILRARRRDVYEAIGHGPNAGLVPAVPR